MLLSAAVIAVIYLVGRWNTSDADHYMGFDNLRPPRKKAARSDGKDAKRQ